MAAHSHYSVSRSANLDDRRIQTSSASHSRPPFSLNDSPSPSLGRASNRLSEAEPIGSRPEGDVVRGRVGRGDREDLFRFRIRERSLVTVTLRGLSNNANIALLDQRGRTLQQSTYPGDSSEVIIRPFTRTGIYYVRVSSRSGSTRYRLEVAAVPRSRIPDDGDGDGGTDPQQPVTQSFLNINEGAASSDPSDLVVIDNFLYFAADNGVNGRELFRISSNQQTATRIIINRTAGEDSEPRDLVNINGTLYFSADNGVNGRELFRITNNETQATLVRDINPTGEESSDPRGLINFNNVLYFSANSGTLGGRELFRSDGTEAGTFRVSDINPGSASSNPTDFAVVGNFLYFAATNTINGRELFRSDGTLNGTTLVPNGDINIGRGPTGAVDSSNPTDLINFNNVLYFAATGDAVGRELFRYDPQTVTGPTVVSNIASGTASSSPGADFSSIVTSEDPAAELNNLLFERPNRSELVVSNNALYFAATGDTVGRELFRSDGTPAGTGLAGNGINSGGNSNPIELTDINGVLYFAATGDVLGNELFRYNPAAGATAQAERVSDINPGDASSEPAEFVLFNNNIVFVATTPAFGRELRILRLTP